MVPTEFATDIAIFGDVDHGRQGSGRLILINDLPENGRMRDRISVHNLIIQYAAGNRLIFSIARIVTHSATTLDLLQKLSLCRHSWATWLAVLYPRIFLG